MSVELTPEQRAAIQTRGEVIVSASAGSGKTFVMIERLVSLVLGGEDVRNILAVTFTNKAAAQMRERLRLALVKGINECDGEKKERLKEQLAALPLAQISTIHAFCGRLIRTNFYAAGVDPAFRIVGGEDAEGAGLRTRALDSVLEKAYAEKDASFELLLSVYFRRKKDDVLRKIVMKLHEKVRGLAGYEEVLSGLGAKDEFARVCDYLAGDVKRRASILARGLEERADVYRGLGEKFAATSDVVCSICQTVLAQDNLFAMRDALSGVAFERMPVKRKVTSEERAAMDFLSGAKKEAEKICEELKELGASDEEHARYLQANSVAAALGKLVLAYDVAYTHEKTEAGVLDYNDLEQIALRLLEREDVRSDLLNKYRAVFVDEYQDVNPVQEKILSLLCGEEIFLVGDAKQAIYGFRGSKSEFFEQKEKTLAHSLRLSTNFRSAPAVLEAVNVVCAPLMENYVPMSGGQRYGEHAGEVRFYLLEKKKTERKQEYGIYSVLEHTGQDKEDALSEKICCLVEEELGKEWLDADTAEVRKVGFGDIAVITRRKEGEAARIAKALLHRGIPVTAAAEVNVCDFFEARLVIDWLSYLDNPEQDVAYCTALLSAIGGLTERELACVRLSCNAMQTKFESFRAACRAYVSLHAEEKIARKIVAFDALTDTLRAHMRVRTAAEMINELLSLGLEAQIAAKEGGRARVSRIRRLIAEGEEVDVNAFLSRLKAGGYQVGYAESGGEDSVRIVTAHSSKGLEYPVVIMAGADVKFGGGSEKEEFLFCSLREGETPVVATKAYDVGKKLVYTTLLRRACLLSEMQEERKQEKNLLYVGMTRAKYRLHIVFCEQPQRAPAPEFAKRFSDFFDFSACERWFVPESEEERIAPSRRSLVHLPDERLKDAVLRVYERPYAYEESTRLPVKSSATALLRGETQTERVYFDDEEPLPKTDKEAGIAYHAFLQHVNFGADVCEELGRMRSILPPEQTALLDVERLEKMLSIPCLASLKDKRIRREQTFLVRLQADEILATDCTQDIVFQGAVDVLAEDEEGYLLIDYKYSVLPDEALRKKYALQIKLYKKAVARVLRIDENTVRAMIVNIARCREIVM